MRYTFYILCIVMTSFCSLQSMELQRVILSSNDNPTYIQFWPVVARVWSAMGFRPTLALIADEQCVVDISIGDVIRFDPIPGISEAMQAQAIRLLLPALFPDDTCLISDIDMIPVSKSYFVDGATRCPEDSFLVYRDLECPEMWRYPMCYLAGKGRVFAEVFGIGDPKEIPYILKEWAALGFGWNTDEFMVFLCVHDYESRGGRVLRLGHGVGRRIDRGESWPQHISSLDVRQYVDCHCPRPYEEFRDEIDQIVEGVLANLIQGSLDN